MKWIPSKIFLSSCLLARLACWEAELLPIRWRKYSFFQDFSAVTQRDNVGITVAGQLFGASVYCRTCKDGSHRHLSVAMNRASVGSKDHLCDHDSVIVLNAHKYQCRAEWRLFIYLFFNMFAYSSVPDVATC